MLGVGFLFTCIVLLAEGKTKWHGVNLAGLDFGGGHYPGVYGKDYESPNTAEVDYYLSKNMNLFRLPFLWERVQPKQNGTFDAQYFGYIENIVNYATGKGAHVLIDPHNYARYYGQLIGTAVPVGAFANFWAQLASKFMGNPRVIFGLMNEPNTMSTELWLSDANAAIKAIRGVHATNLITVPGNAWTGAWDWSQNWYGTPNSEVMKGVVDPLNNYVIEVHNYMDSDHSGTHPECVSPTVGSESLMNFTGWARQQKVKAFLAEWAGGRNEVCYEAVTNLLKYVDANLDVWEGWTWWAGGPMWGDYIFTLDPDNGQDRPQMHYLEPFL